MKAVEMNEVYTSWSFKLKEQEKKTELPGQRSG
jgi:hypothetical protein